MRCGGGASNCSDMYLGVIRVSLVWLQIWGLGLSTFVGCIVVGEAPLW